ncbi:CHAT domain-containing protein [Mastigocladopsis repens]|uniref:CHAT domain-containing protein n=1 Tax=Mastigocladopsis repens TaxID=221287 RepID=UPI0002E32378|nr:CHAT domain-containing protein [Mastigocladopsis repens]
MGRVAVLKVGSGDFDQGFDVSLQVCRDNALPSPEIPGRLPANTEFEDLYTVWQETFVRLRTQRGTDSDWQIETRPTNYSTSEVDACRYFVRNLETSMINWLQHSQDQGWQKIRERLVKELANKSDEFRVIITAINSELCKLPWHVWDLMESNPDVEIAFSYPNDGESELPETNYNNQVRILAILGDSSGIDTEPDRDAIRQLNDAKPEFLPQPTSRELINCLRRREGWDIFFFAGHSETNGEIARIYINESESLEISHFKNALKEAIRYGLKLAIFNSCDGLGLAQQLADLHIPVIIVMCEPVPDEVAQSFLRQFLTEYAYGQPLYTSVRRARERLEEFQDLPGATWLPVICQNPAKVPPTWQELRHPKRKGQILLSWLWPQTVLLLSVVGWLGLASAILILAKLPQILQVPQHPSQSQVELNTLVGKWKTTWSYETTETKMEILEKKRLDGTIAEYTFSYLNNKNRIIKGKIKGKLYKQGKVLKGTFYDETGGNCYFVLSSNGYKFDGEWSDDTGKKGRWTGERISSAGWQK